MNFWDLHCDLLLFLAKDATRTPFQEEARCSLPQLHKGKVSFQTLALFTPSKPGSVLRGKQQIEALKKWRSHFKENHIQTLPALENASLLIEEEENLDRAFDRFDAYEKEVGPFLYVSLTWNGENRFGGGNATDIGLKKDGEIFLEFLGQKKCAIDFSHTSDALARGILNHLEKKKLPLRPMASHSNFRYVNPHVRNLPDEIAQEIFRRKGIIGLNLIRSFVGEEADFESKFLQMVERGILLGGENQLCLGADFFYEEDVAQELSSLGPFFNSQYADATSYPQLYLLLKEKFSETLAQKVAFQNCAQFIDKLCIL